MKNGLVLFLELSIVILAVGGVLHWLSGGMVVVAGENTAVIHIDHQAVDAEQIPQQWLDAVRELDVFFAHRSVGNNILAGMEQMEIDDAQRYSLPIVSTAASWFATNNGILHQPLGINTEPQTKIDGFNTFIRDEYHPADIAMMKFCPSDPIPFGTIPAADIWAAYRDMMLALEQDYPDVLFVWWTFPLSTAADNRGNDEKAIFNGLVRDYCDANGCILFDIADMQSHDPDDNPVVSATGHEAMWNGYSTDGAHLNEVGQQRIAGAYWWLLARLAGWETPQSPPGFTVDILPEVQPVLWNSTAVYTIAVNNVGEFSQTIQLHVDQLPAETAVSWGPTSLQPGETTTLSLSVTPTVPCADYHFNIVGTAITLTERSTATLQVRRPTFLPLIVK